MGLDQVLGLLRILILARLLAPEDFGLYAVAAIALGVVAAVSETGFQAALVQRPGDIAPHLDTAWTVQALRGLLVSLLLFLIAPSLSAFFGREEATTFLRVAGLAPALAGLTSLSLIKLTRELEFRPRFAVHGAATAAELVAAVAVALWLRNAWAFLAGLFAGHLVRLVGSYLIHPYRPRLRLEAQRIRELAGFGLWVTATRILGYVNSNLPRIFVGRVLGVPDLGLFQLASRLPQATVHRIGNLGRSVAFPAYSRLQDRAGLLRRAYFEVAGMTVALALPLATGLALLGGDFARVFLGEGWVPMVPALVALAAAELLQAFALTGSSLLWAVGSPRMVLIVQGLRTVTLLALVPLLLQRWDLLGAALGVLAASGIGCLVWIWILKQRLAVGWFGMAKGFLPQLAAGVAMATILYLSRPVSAALVAGGWLPEAAAVVLAGAVGGLVFVGVLVACSWMWPQHPFFAGVRRLIASVRGESPPQVG